MTPRLIFWLYAMVLTCGIIGCAFVGISHARNGRYQLHRLWMNASSWIIVGFVGSYILKVIFLGKEDLQTWDSFYVVTLRIHEFFIAVMLGCGGFARYLAHQFRHTLDETQLSTHWRKKRDTHKKLGKLSIYGACAALITACALIVGMLQRAALI